MQTGGQPFSMTMPHHGCAKTLHSTSAWQRRGTGSCLLLTKTVSLVCYHQGWGRSRCEGSWGWACGWGRRSCGECLGCFCDFRGFSTRKKLGGHYRELGDSTKRGGCWVVGWNENQVYRVRLQWSTLRLMRCRLGQAHLSGTASHTRQLEPGQERVLDFHPA